MTSSKLPRDVQAFILSAINSVEQLEILLLLRRVGESDTAAITRELRTSQDSVDLRIADLIKKGLLSERDSAGQRIFKISAPEKQAKALAELASLYVTHRVSVIEAIYAPPTDALRSFAEAFIIREKK